MCSLQLPGLQSLDLLLQLAPNSTELILSSNQLVYQPHCQQHDVKQLHDEQSQSLVDCVAPTVQFMHIFCALSLQAHNSLHCLDQRAHLLPAAIGFLGEEQANAPCQRGAGFRTPLTMQELTEQDISQSVHASCFIHNSAPIPLCTPCSLSVPIQSLGLNLPSLTLFSEPTPD